MSTIVCFGEILLRLAAPGLEPLLRSGRLDAQFGGAEANTGISLAYFGHRARLVSTLPDNDIGRVCLGELRRHGADVSGIALQPGRMGLYFYTAPAQLRPAQVLYDRAGSAFAAADPAAYDWNSLLAGADWLHISGITPALGQRAADALQRAVTAARASNVRISFDCNIRPSLWAGRESEAPAIIGTFARSAQLLFGNCTDIAVLFGGNYAGLAPQEAQMRAAARAFEACPALDYVTALFQGLSAEAAAERDRGLETMPVEHETPGGLNEQVRLALTAHGTFTELTRQLDDLLRTRSMAARPD